MNLYYGNVLIHIVEKFIVNSSVQRVSLRDFNTLHVQFQYAYLSETM